jgi:hypothetical protein
MNTLPAVALCLALALPVAAYPSVAGACELKLLPPSVTLRGAGDFHRLTLVETMHGTVTKDVTALGEFSSSAPGVATVDKDGTVRAVGDGEAVITATLPPRTVRITVRVEAAKAPTAWSFRNDVIPVLTRGACNSGACHGALAGKGGLKLSLRGYDLDADHFAITRQALGRRIDRGAGSAADSLLVTKPLGVVKHGGGPRLAGGSLDERILVEWIAAGAPAHAEADPTLKGIEIVPPEASLKPGEKLRLIVRATYTDGRVRDVTHWARFVGSDDLVATVDADGRVTVAGRGETAITAVFAGMPAVARIVSPSEKEVADDVFAKARHANFIDELVLKKLAALRIPPSPDCTDHEFIRRAFLDAAGTLPTPAEVAAFVADTSADKRAKLVDALLSRPEYVDYWTYKWGDLLLVSSKLPTQTMWSYHAFVRRSVADNKPWDRFAREILTAKGSTLENGAGAYFVLHKDITDLTETTSVTFLGMSLTCARCHNHPLEKWTQDQYYAMANLLSRVKLKNGERPGETLVIAAPTGDVLHPRTGRPMPPQPLDGPVTDPSAAADRREAFADWLTRPENPFFARAAVNRVWRNFFGRGLVEAEEDMRATNPATNEELLAALTADFAKNGHDVKRLIRLIMTSATYQRSGRPVPGNETDDRFGSRYVPKRLAAEVLLDAYSQITGVPTEFRKMSRDGNPTGDPYAAGTRAQQLPDVQILSPFLASFGRPVREQSCSCERNSESTVGQALHVNNGKTLNEKLRSPRSVAEAWLNEKVADGELVDRAFLLVLSRPPTAEERSKMLAAIADASDLAAADGKADGKADAKSKEADAKAARRQVIEDVLWSLATSTEFLFNH